MYSPTDHSFAVCAYGKSPYLDLCLKSLSAQTVHTNLIVSTSTPNAHIEEVAQKYGVPLFVNEGAPSISHDWNCAVSHCSTPLVTIAHQDDVYLPQFAERTIEALNNADHPLISFTDYSFGQENVA